MYACQVGKTQAPSVGGVTASWTRADRIWVGSLFGVALALRLIHLLTIRDSPFFIHLMLDPLMYDEWGRRIAAGAWIGESAFFQDPLYAYFLGVLYALVGQRFLVVVVVQGLLGALVSPLLYLAARRWFGRAPAAAAGLLAAFYLPAIYYDALILKTWMTLFLVALAMWLLSRALSPLPRTGPGRGVGCGSVSCWAWPA